MAATAVHPVSNDAETTISFTEPYAVSVTIRGTAPFLFHRWNVDAIAEKAKAHKGSKAKKEDDTESFVYRDDDGNLAIPAEYLRMSIVNAAKFNQDPRSPRKSAMDLFKAGVVPLTDLCTTGHKDWDYLDRRRVMVQRNGITRSRPALAKGWTISADFQIIVPEYISSEMFNEVVQKAGKLIGIGDFRPTFGRFQVVNFTILE